MNETIILFEHLTQTNQTSPTQIVYADKDNVSDILRFDPRGCVRMFRRFLANGDKGYLAYMNGICVSRIWVQHGPQKAYLGHPLVSMSLKENEVYIHDGKTAPEARGKNVFPHALSRLVEDFRGNLIYIAILGRNSESLKGVTKAGFAQRQKIHLLVVLGITVSYNIEFCS